MVMTLFEKHSEKLASLNASLAARMRPRTLEEYAGQRSLVGEGCALRRAIDEDKVSSIILWGPPGSGKTTLARIISRSTNAYFDHMSAVNSGVGDVRKVVQDAKHRLGENGRRTILFLDEIHRFSKSQQDALLPHIEEGIITLIGATTENPSFEVISPLLSRVRVYVLEPLSDADVSSVIERALKDGERGLGKMNLRLGDNTLEMLLSFSSGDARSALDALEIIANTAPVLKSDGPVTIKPKHVSDALQKRSRYDKAGDAHYDSISAFIKSVRSSDPDAALHYLARMLDSGEDHMFIARRLVVSAAEDIGLANPQALVLASATQQAVHLIGMPEGRIPLAQATIYLACSPKSNSAYTAIEAALKQVRSAADEPIPMHLRNAPTKLMKELGYGKGYKYSHRFSESFVKMENLPSRIKDAIYYRPGDNQVERRIAARLRHWWGDEKYPRSEN